MPSKSWKNLPKKLHTYGSWEFFFSAASTAQNSPELHFRFINTPIQSSVLESVIWPLPSLSQLLVLTFDTVFTGAYLFLSERMGGTDKTVKMLSNILLNLQNTLEIYFLIPLKVFKAKLWSVGVKIPPNFPPFLM